MNKTFFVALVAVSLGLAGSPSAQIPAVDPSDRLKEVLPADVAGRVLATIAQARARELPAQALANRALKFAARGVNPLDIERSVTEHAIRLERGRAALDAAGGERADADELEAGSEALRLGVDPAALQELAKSAPSGRSLAVPLFVIGSLVERGLPSNEALQRVLERLQARASDTELEQLPAQAQGGPAQKGQGQAKALSNRPGSAGGSMGRASQGGRPLSLPANPGQGKKPDAPPGRP
jgi:phage terminase Nu1 subunit (DNA packaging protein)